MQNLSVANSKPINGSDKSNPKQPTKKPGDAKAVDSTNPNARGIASSLAEVGKKAGTIGMDVASKGVDVLADTTTHLVQEKAKAMIRITVTDRIRDISQMFHVIPGGQRLLSSIISNVFYPYYKKANPNTTLSPDQIAEHLMRGHTEFLEDDLINTFDKFIRDNLSEENKIKYENGEKKVVLSAFKNMLMSQVKTAKEPGGIKKIATGIANWIPFVNRLPDAVKPWVGGAIGGFVGYKVLHGLWKLVKWAVLGFTGYKGIQMIKNRFGGGGAPAPELPDEEAAAKPKSKMASVLEGVSKMAQMAGGPGAGMMGGGGPAGGLGGLVSALAGGGR